MKKFCCFFICMCFVFSVFSQESLKSFQDEYYDFLFLQGITDKPTISYKTLSDSTWKIGTDSNHPWNNIVAGTSYTLFQTDKSSNFFVDGIDTSLKLRIYGPSWYNSYNQDQPFGQNDGALWQGVGYNTSFSSGVRLEGFGFEATFKPQITYSQNKDWDYLTSTRGGPYGYFTDYASIDLVQRYGEDPLYTYSWGDSEIRWTWHTFTVGFGTQSPWLGPSYLNPMLGSNNADPYLKLDIGLRKTPLTIPFVDWYLGDFESRVWVGRLKQSDYFINPRSDSDRMVTMGSFSFSPSFVNGFSVGMNRLFMTYWKQENVSYIFRLFDDKIKNGTGTGNDEDQKVAFFADWSFPDNGFEVYGEYGIDDFTLYQWANPFHTGIYTLGVKQIIPLTNTLKGILNLEWNGFEMSQDFQLQWRYGGYYFHSAVNQGFTNNGQIIGAGTGSMGNSQFASYTLYYPKGKTAFTFHRFSPDNNYILNKAVNDVADNVYDEWYAKYKTYIAIGAETLYFISPSFAVSAGGNWIRRIFPKYNSDLGEGYIWHITYNFSLGFTYSF